MNTRCMMIIISISSNAVPKRSLHFPKNRSGMLSGQGKGESVLDFFLSSVAVRGERRVFLPWHFVALVFFSWRRMGLGSKEDGVNTCTNTE